MTPRTKIVDGLEFVVPTWDEGAGAWAEDAAVTERVLAGIRAAVPDHAELVAEALANTEYVTDGAEYCGTYWGSHGCDRPVRHDGLCVCDAMGMCSAGLKYGDGDTFILWWEDEVTGLRLAPHHWRWFR